jgi:hypothetical protein
MARQVPIRSSRRLGVSVRQHIHIAQTLQRGSMWETEVRETQSVLCVISCRVQQIFEACIQHTVETLIHRAQSKMGHKTENVSVPDERVDSP